MTEYDYCGKHELESEKIIQQKYTIDRIYTSSEYNYSQLTALVSVGEGDGANVAGWSHGPWLVHVALAIRQTGCSACGA